MTTAIERAVYRGRRTDTGELVYGCLVSNDEDDHTIYSFDDNDDDNVRGWDCYDVDPETIVQWSGRCYDNKIRIFEGDCVKIHTLHNTAERGEKAIMYWHIDGWHLDISSFYPKSDGWLIRVNGEMSFTICDKERDDN